MPKMNLAAQVDTGEKALQYLRREGEYADAVRPSLVLLDINLPGISGIDVLNEVKSDPELKTIPVVMLTASSDDRDIAKSYASGASTFISKPVQQDDFQDVVKQFASYWTGAAKFPPGE
jgi:CheY-like chemotaxis protein